MSGLKTLLDAVPFLPAFYFEHVTIDKVKNGF